MCCVLSNSCLETELAMPDFRMNHSFDLIGQLGLQKGLKLFAIQFDLLRQTQAGFSTL